MSLEGFSSFLKTIELSNSIDENQVGKYFNLAMSIVVNEIGSDNHTKMRNKLEFFEAVSRLVDESGLPFQMDGIQ